MKNDQWIGILAGGAVGAWLGAVFAIKAWPKIFKCDLLSSTPETQACRSQENMQVATVVVCALVAGAGIGYDVSKGPAKILTFDP